MFVALCGLAFRGAVHMTTGVPGVVGSIPSGSNASELLKQLLKPDQAFRRIVPVAIDGAPAGLCVRTLTTAEALRRDQLREALFTHLDSVEGAIDEQAARDGAKAEEDKDGPGATPAQRAMLIRANRRAALATALAVAFVACDANGGEVFSKDAASNDAWKRPTVPTKPANAGGDGQAAAGVGGANGTGIAPIPSDAVEAWQRAMLVEQALPFAVAAELVVGSQRLSKAQRDDLGKVSWSGQPSST
jgi:hypothetical protein